MRRCMLPIFLLAVFHSIICEITGNTPNGIEEKLEQFLQNLGNSEELRRQFNIDADLYESYDGISDTRKKRAVGWQSWFGNRNFGGGRADRQGGFGAQNFGGFGGQNFGGSALSGLGLAGYTYNLINTIRLLSQGLGLGYLERLSAVVREVDTYDCVPRAICEYSANQTYQTRQAQLRETQKEATKLKADNKLSNKTEASNKTETSTETSTERPWYTRFAPTPENIPQYLTLVRALNLDQTNSFHIIRPAMFGVHKASVSECSTQYKQCNGSYSDAFIDTVNNMDGGIVGALSRIGNLLGIGNNGLGAAAGQTSAADLFSAAGLGSLPGAGLASVGQTVASLAANSLSAPSGGGLGQSANPFGFNQQQLNSLTPEQTRYYQQVLLAQQQQALSQQQLNPAQFNRPAASGPGGNAFDLSPLILRGVNAIRGVLGGRNRGNAQGAPSLQDLVLDSDQLDPNDFDFESRNNQQLRGSRGIVHRIPNRFDAGHPNTIPAQPPRQPIRYNPPAPVQYHGQIHQPVTSGGRQAAPFPAQTTPRPNPQQFGRPPANRVPYNVPTTQLPISAQSTNIFGENIIHPKGNDWRFLSDPQQERPVQRSQPHTNLRDVNPSLAESRGRQLGRVPDTRSGKILFRD